MQKVRGSVVLAAVVQRPDVNQNKCLNRRICKINCQKCAAACPNRSVSVDLSDRAEPVSLMDSCTGCGLCAAACPAEAIVISHKLPKLELKNGAVEFVCSKQQLDSSIECLGLLDAYALAYYGMKTELVRIVLDCQRCEVCNPGVTATVKQTIGRANAVLRNLGRRDIQLALRYGKEDIKVNRRDLLAFCFSRAKETLLDMLPLSINQDKSYRKLLIESIPPEMVRGAKPDMSPLFWGGEVNEQCDLCGVCVRSCQQDALTMTVEEQSGHRELLHNQSKCIGCMACTLLCSHSALQIANTLSNVRIIASQKPVVLTGKKCCTRCGKVMGTESPLLCGQCLEESKPYLQSIY